MRHCLVIDDLRESRSGVHPPDSARTEPRSDRGRQRSGRYRPASSEFRGHTDLVLVDWNMPVMDGLEFIQAVRGQRIYDPVRIVMVTTETESDQMNRAMAAGANEYVMKPFTRDVLVAKLSMLDVFGV